MRPLTQYRQHKDKGMNFRKDVILDYLDSCPRLVCDLIKVCVWSELGSQATIHREIHEMIDKKFIIAKRNKQDSRRILLSISASGKKYLEKL